MRRLTVLALGLWAAGVGVHAGQSQAPVDPADRPVFRLTTSLVQLDAVVTDKRGRHVTTLGPDDFEVYQNGRLQPVTAAVYVDGGETWVDTSGLPPLPPEALRPADARRVIGIVVDDLRMSFESMHHARRGLLAFVDEQFQEGDLGAVVTTSRGFMRRRALTHQRGELRADVSRLRYSLFGTTAASILDPADGLEGFDAAEQAREYQFATSAIARLDAVLQHMRELPGRKAIILVSEGFTLFGPGMDNATVRYLMQRLVDRANRAGTVIYAIDPRGLMTAGITAADGSMSPRRMSALAAARRAALRETQDSLRYVAGETGGFAVVNSNDLAHGMRRIVDDLRGYYLIGYQPESGTVSPTSTRRFWRVTVKVKQKGLKVRTRAGFYGRPTR